MSKLHVIRQSFACRLNRILAERGIEERERLGHLAVLIGVGTSAPERWLNAESMPSSHFLSLLATEFGVRLEWLRSGRGEKYGEEQNRKRRYHT